MFEMWDIRYGNQGWLSLAWGVQREGRIAIGYHFWPDDNFDDNPRPIINVLDEHDTHLDTITYV